MKSTTRLERDAPAFVLSADDGSLEEIKGIVESCAEPGDRVELQFRLRCWDPKRRCETIHHCDSIEEVRSFPRLDRRILESFELYVSMPRKMNQSGISHVVVDSCGGVWGGPTVLIWQEGECPGDELSGRLADFLKARQRRGGPPRTNYGTFGILGALFCCMALCTILSLGFKEPWDAAMAGASLMFAAPMMGIVLLRTLRRVGLPWLHSRLVWSEADELDEAPAD